MAAPIGGKLDRQRETKRRSGLAAGAPLRGSPTFGGSPSLLSRPPKGGQPTSPPRSRLHRPRQDQAPRQLNGRKRQSARRGQADRLRLDPTASQDGRPQGWTPEEGPPLKSQMVTWIWHRQKWRGWPRLAPAPSAAGARPGRTITPKAGGWAVRPSKNASTAPYAAGIRRPGARRPTWPGRARSILPVCL